MVVEWLTVLTRFEYFTLTFVSNKWKDFTKFKNKSHLCEVKGEIAVKRKALSEILLILLVISTLPPTLNVQPVIAEDPLATAIIYVPDDYPKIQWAIDNASAGDTIIVRDGVYYENVDVNKQLTIKSENGSADCIVKAADPYDHVFHVTADHVKVIGFTIESGARHFSGADIMLEGDYCIISENNLSNNTYGVYLSESNNNIILENNIKNSGGIHLWSSNNNMISRNSIKNNTHGIKGWHSDNITILNNSIENNYEGIWLYASDYSTISGNNISNNNRGVELLGALFGYYPGARYNIISGNSIKSNKEYGIYLDDTDHSLILENNISDNGNGMCIRDSDDNTISGNNISNNCKGIEFWHSENNQLSSNTFINDGLSFYFSYQNTVFNNTINGKPLVYLESVSDLIVEDAGQVILVNCKNITLKKLSLSNADVGVQLLKSDDCVISENSMKNNRIGIYLEYSNNNKISKNRITSNNEYGIDFYQSNNNIVSGNSIENNGNGTYLFSSNNNTISGNSITENIGCGIEIYYSSDNNLILGNNLKSNKKQGIYLHQDSNYNVISGNNISKSYYGIYFDRSNHNTISRNNITNGHWAIYLFDCSNNKIYHNNFVDNDQQVFVIPSYANVWDDDYPSGGNYWSDYTGDDKYSGPNQDQPGSDGIGDTPYIIDDNNIDRYPLMKAWTPTPENRPPTCVIKLQKDRVEINEIDIDEFFDIYVGNSTDDKGIVQVRFSSDDIQDGIPTGKWTEWYNWNISSGDWNASTKIKRWAFTTPGYKEVWAEVKDDIGQIGRGFAVIFVPYPSLPVIVSPLAITPAKDFYTVGDSVTGEFTIKNIGDTPISFDILTIGGRLNGWSVVDFTHVSVTLRPGESYHYEGHLTFNQRGSYHFFVAYYIQSPTDQEKKLLDENNWNTCVQLGEGLSHADRVKNLVVFDEGVVPEEVSKLRDKIDQLKKQPPNYPPYLLDPNSFWSAVAVIWMDTTSWLTRTHLTEKYDELYNTGIYYDCLRFKALINAEDLLDAGDIEGAKRYLRKSLKYDKLSAMSFTSAAEVFENNLEVAESLAEAIKDGCEAAVRMGVKIVYPPAAPIVDAIYTSIDFTITAKIEGIEQATKDLIIEVLTDQLLKNVKFVSLEDNILVDYVNKVTERVSLDTLLADKEFIEEYGDVLRETIAVKIVNELGISLSEEEIKELAEDCVGYLQSLTNSIKAKVKSPVELRVINSEGKITGLVDRRVRHEIPMSFYKNGTIVIFFPGDLYIYEVIGTGTGTYSLQITLSTNGNITTFSTISIPILNNTIHQYTINWSILSTGGEGAKVQVDSDGDGVFEHIFSSDDRLTQSEYIIATDDIPPETTMLIGEPKFVVEEMIYLTSATPISFIAEDNVGGSGVASTSFRIYNVNYNSGWINYTRPFYLVGLPDGSYHIEFNSTDNAGNMEPIKAVMVFLDNTPPSTDITIGEPKYVSETIYVTSKAPLILEANDGEGAGIHSVVYRIYNETYDSGWLLYTEPFYLTGLADGVYMIEFNGTDNLGNVEAVKSIRVRLFSWNFIFMDSYGRDATLKINVQHKFFQFITSDKDYGIKKASWMQVYHITLLIYYKDDHLKLISKAIPKIDFCFTIAWDRETHTRYVLIDKVGES